MGGALTKYQVILKGEEGVINDGSYEVGWGNIIFSYRVIIGDWVKLHVLYHKE